MVLPSNAKPIKRLKTLLTSGNLWLYVLSIMTHKGEVYAYALDSEIESTYKFKPNKIMIYVVLYKLEHEGLISSQFKERRKYYTITKSGSQTIALAKDYFETLAKKL